MKKFIGLLVILLIFVTGCGKKGSKDILKDFNKKVNSMNAYYLEGKWK